MTRATHTLASFAFILACSSNAPQPRSSPQPPIGPLAAPEATWTPDQVRKFVVDIDVAITKRVSKLAYGGADRNPVGVCFDQPARPLAKVSETLPWLGTMVEGRAFPCYLASYFGCVVDDWVAMAGIAHLGPGTVPFTQAKVVIVEQTPTKVVADISEVDSQAAFGGVLDKDQTQDRTEFGLKSRYTLNRDIKGIWRIADRVPDKGVEWECRPR